jgi:hypothetical protein
MPASYASLHADGFLNEHGPVLVVPILAQEML